MLTEKMIAANANLDVSETDDIACIITPGAIRLIFSTMAVVHLNTLPTPSINITKKRGIRSNPIAKLHMSAALDERAITEIKVPIAA